jgi:hypothetical protein
VVDDRSPSAIFRSDRVSQEITCIGGTIVSLQYLADGLTGPLGSDELAAPTSIVQNFAASVQEVAETMAMAAFD